MAPISHKNRKGQVYYLHMGQTKTGKPKYFFSQKADGDTLSTIPDGYEIFEHPDGPVYMQRKVPQVITDVEVAIVERELASVRTIRRGQVVRKGTILTVYVADSSVLGDLNDDLFSASFYAVLAAHARMTATFRFELVDESDRQFQTYRYCYRGSVDDWIPIGNAGAIDQVALRFLKHAGRESYFELTLYDMYTGMDNETG
jgi:hypothetical protein